MSGTLKSMWEHCSIMRMRPGTKLPNEGDSYLQPTWTMCSVCIPGRFLHVRKYKDWSTDFEDKPALLEHFVWLSEEFMPVLYGSWKTTYPT